MTDGRTAIKEGCLARSCFETKASLIRHHRFATQEWAVDLLYRVTHAGCIPSFHHKHSIDARIVRVWGCFSSRLQKQRVTLAGPGHFSTSKLVFAVVLLERQKQRIMFGPGAGEVRSVWTSILKFQNTPRKHLLIVYLFFLFAASRISYFCPRICSLCWMYPHF